MRIFVILIVSIAAVTGSLGSHIEAAAAPTYQQVSTHGGQFPSITESTALIYIHNAQQAKNKAEMESAAAAIAERNKNVQTPPRVISSTPAPVNRLSGCGYESLIRSYFGSAGDWAVSIAMRESRCTPGAKSPTGCWGLFQLCVPLHMGIFRYVCPDLSATLGNDVALDPECGVKAALHLYNGSGTRPWHF